jgi:sulfite oxidase
MTAYAEHPQVTVALSESPTVRATPLSLLGSAEIPTEAHFRRDHFPAPFLDPDTWALDIEGAVSRRLSLSIEDIRRLPSTSLRVVLECAGHRRGEYAPAARGVQWGYGAMSEAVWTGVPLRELLDIAAPHGATHAVLEGVDSGPVGEEGKVASFARAIPLEKALHPDTLLAWQMNGLPLPIAHGAPLRAIVPGWYATDSVKWLSSITLVSRPFDGHFEKADYRLPDPDRPEGRRMTVLAVHALLTSVADGAVIHPGAHVLHGVAWGGEEGLNAVDVSVDGGPWRSARLELVPGPYARTPWRLEWEAESGLHTIRVRATDGTGRSQPVRPAWNERGFANASVQRVSVGVF